MESGEPTEHFPRNILTSYCPTETCFITNAGFQCQILQVWHLLLLIFEFLEVFMSPLKRNKITGNHAVFTIRTVYIRILDNMYIYIRIYICVFFPCSPYSNLFLLPNANINLGGKSGMVRGLFFCKALVYKLLGSCGKSNDKLVSFFNRPI